MRRPTALLALFLLALVSLPVSAQAEFGFKEFDVQSAAGPPSPLDWTSTDAAAGQFTQAGGHPYAIVTHVAWNSHPDTIHPPAYRGLLLPDGSIKDTVADLPAGTIGNPLTTETCSAEQLLGLGSGLLQAPSECPTGSQVGTVHLELNLSGTEAIEDGSATAPLFNVQPPSGVPARFGFNLARTLVYFDGALSDEGGYHITIGPRAAPQALQIDGSDIVFWGAPGDPRHDAQRCNYKFFGWPGSTTAASCPGAPGEDSARTPAAGWARRRCSACRLRAPRPGKARRGGSAATPGRRRGAFDQRTVHNHLPPYLPGGAPGPQEGTTGCDRVPFDPDFSARPTTADAASSSGLEIGLSFPSDGLDNPEGIAQSHLKKAVVKLPKGMQINPSQAEGLGVCGSSEYAAVSVTNEGCPSTSKIGTVQVKTPLLTETVPGNVYVAKPYDNPSNSLIALYIVLREPNAGSRSSWREGSRPTPTLARSPPPSTICPSCPSKASPSSSARDRGRR